MLDGVTQGDASRIYEVRAESANGRVHAFGARRTRPEAEELLRDWTRRVDAARGRNQRHWIEEIDTTGLWQPPPQPKPRDRYATRVTTSTPPGKWKRVHVDVLDGDAVIAGYDRNYSMLQTFEPFRQGDRVFALISTHYTASSVMDLNTATSLPPKSPPQMGSARSGSTSRTGGTSTTARNY